MQKAVSCLVPSLGPRRDASLPILRLLHFGSLQSANGESHGRAGVAQCFQTERERGCMDDGRLTLAIDTVCRRPLSR